MIDRLFGVFLLLLGLFFIWGGASLEVPFSYDPLGPKFFPIAAGGLLSLLSLFVIAKPKKIDFPEFSTLVKTGLIILLLVIYQFTFNVLGFLIATAILVFFMSRIFKGTSKQALGSAIGVSVSVYLIFGILLDVPLPHGVILNFLLGVS
ncbi:MAG: tripartite tricarboxylate transporter TctB family protein [Sulfurospirillaceae bacterium]|nr:tripartite tricarboxylate transporter TctB family protein [Sulfurospirillaceae bacterium]